MGKKLGTFLKTALFLIIAGCTLLIVIAATERKESYIKNKVFFDEAKKDNIDVLFFGSSHVINGINPAVLYDEYGITSYNLGGHGSLLQESYWQLIRALELCKPKYVVVDAYMLEKDYQFIDRMYEDSSDADRQTSVDQLHLNMDAYPLSKLKIAAVNDLVQDPDIRRQFLFDFEVYHDRWKELTGEDFKKLTGNLEVNSLMGAEMRYGVKTDVDEYESALEGETLPDITVGGNYLMKIIDECQRDGIGIVVTYLPFSATTTDQIAANSAEEIAAMYDVTCLNMLKAEGIIDEAADLNDHGHLNVIGAKKVTEYIGDYFSSLGIFEDHRGDEKYKDYDEAAKAYKKELANYINDCADLPEKLNLLRESDLNVVLFVNEDSDALTDSGLRHLISNLSGTKAIDEGAAIGVSYLLIKDRTTGEVAESCGLVNLEGIHTALGDLNYIPIEKKFRLLYPTSDEESNFLYDDSHTSEDIQIILYDDNGDIVEHLYFTSAGREYVLS